MWCKARRGKTQCMRRPRLERRSLLRRRRWMSGCCSAFAARRTKPAASLPTRARAQNSYTGREAECRPRSLRCSIPAKPPPCRGVWCMCALRAFLSCVGEPERIALGSRYLSLSCMSHPKARGRRKRALDCARCRQTH